MIPRIAVFFMAGVLLFSAPALARSTKKMTAGIMALGNIQILSTMPNLDPGPGGGAFFDYRFNQRFSITIDAWATTHDGTSRSAGDNSIQILGIPTGTLKIYIMDDETSKWDPYVGVGIGAYATTEGSIANGTNGVGLGAQIETGVDYYFSDILSAGFAGVFRSTAIINSLSNSGTNASALLPYTLVAKAGFHF